MRNIKQAVSTGLFLAGLAMANSASAGLIVDQFVGAPTNIIVGSPFSFTHDFTDNLAPNNYAAGFDTITSALLKIILTDDNGNEDYTISFGTEPQVSNFTANIAGNTDFNFSVLAPSLANLSVTGTLPVTISATSCNGNRCDQYALQFLSSTLTVDATRATLASPTIEPTNGVPEPATIGLFGLGLAAIGFQRRKRAA